MNIHAINVARIAAGSNGITPAASMDVSPALEQGYSQRSTGERCSPTGVHSYGIYSNDSYYGYHAGLTNAQGATVWKNVVDHSHPVRLIGCRIRPARSVNGWAAFC